MAVGGSYADVFDWGPEPSVITPAVEPVRPVGEKSGGGSDGDKSDASSDLSSERAAPESVRVEEPEPVQQAPVQQEPDIAPERESFSRDVSEDMRHDALSGGSGGSNSQVETVSSDDSDTSGKNARKRAGGGGRAASSDVNATSRCDVPSSLSYFASQTFGKGTKQGDAVAAYLYKFYQILGHDVEVPERIKVLAEQVDFQANSDLDLHRELETLRYENSKLTGQLKELTGTLAEVHNMLVFLIGARMRSPGTSLNVGALGLQLDFSDADLIRTRVHSQTLDILADKKKREGRELEERIFRNQHAVKKD